MGYNYWYEIDGGFLAFDTPLMPMLMFYAYIPYLIVADILQHKLLKMEKEQNFKIPKKVMTSVITSGLLFVAAFIIIIISVILSLYI